MDMVYKLGETLAQNQNIYQKNVNFTKLRIHYSVGWRKFDRLYLKFKIRCITSAPTQQH